MKVGNGSKIKVVPGSTEEGEDWVISPKLRWGVIELIVDYKYNIGDPNSFGRWVLNILINNII